MPLSDPEGRITRCQHFFGRDEDRVGLVDPIQVLTRRKGILLNVEKKRSHFGKAKIEKATAQRMGQRRNGFAIRLGILQPQFLELHLRALDQFPRNRRHVRLHCIRVVAQERGGLGPIEIGFVGLAHSKVDAGKVAL